MTNSVRSIVGNLGRQLSCAIPLGVWRRVVPRDVIALCYHVVSDRPLEHVRNLYDYKSPDDFRRDLLFLRKNYRVIDYQELHEHRLHGKPLAGPSVHLSFDDGLAECHSVARPLLRELGLPCTFFVNSDFLDNRDLFYRSLASLLIDRIKAHSHEDLASARRVATERSGQSLDDKRQLIAWVSSLGLADRATLDQLAAALSLDVMHYLAERRPYLTRDEVKGLALEGFTIGGHTRSHERLTGATDAGSLERSIVESCRDVAELTGQAVRPFAFPFTGAGIDRELIARVRRDHPSIGLIFDTQKLKKDRDFVVNRICCDQPPPDTWGESNLPEALCKAYFSQTAGALGA